MGKQERSPEKLLGSCRLESAVSWGTRQEELVGKDARAGRSRALSGPVELEMMSKNPNDGHLKDKFCVSVRCDHERGRKCAGAGFSASQEPTACISSQLHTQRRHVGSLKQALLGERTPWKLANITNQGSFFLES